MSTLALHQTYRDMGLFRSAVSGLVRWRALIIAFALGFPLFFYLMMLAVLMIRYGELANYITPYNWPGNVWRIIVSTGSVADMIPIVANEWLLEIGYMNFAYGHGIADWSLSIVPHKIVMLSLTGALIGLNVGLLVDRQSRATAFWGCLNACRTGLLTSAGALSASVTSATVFSIACCATPSWVGSLAVLGVETSAAFALEPYGTAALLFGLAALIVSALLLAREKYFADDPLLPPLQQRAAPC